jgi:hypothetical protein
MNGKDEFCFFVERLIPRQGGGGMPDVIFIRVKAIELIY